MNLIIDKGFFDRLIRKYQIYETTFGSDNFDSDKDYIHFIRYDISLEALSPYYRGNPLQYKDNQGNDHIVININQFVQSLINGDNFLIYKLVEKIEDCGELWYISHANKEGMFETYKKYKSLLGVARRDFKDHFKLLGEDNDFCQRKAKKKLNFAISEYNRVAEFLGEKLLAVGEELDYTDLTDSLRGVLNKKLEAGDIDFTVDPVKFVNLSAHMSQFTAGYDSYEFSHILKLYADNK